LGGIHPEKTGRETKKRRQKMKITEQDKREWEIETREAWLNSPAPPKESKRYCLPTWEDSIPFAEDVNLFLDSDYDMIKEDGFESIESVKYNRVYGKKGHYEIINYNPENDIKDRLLNATPPDFNQELDISAKSDARCINRFFDDKGNRCHNNLPRQIVEDCTFTANRIEVPQLIGPGACSIQAHLRIEQISQFSGMTYKESHLMAQFLKALDLDFNTWVLKPVIKKEKNRLGNTIWTKASLSTRLNRWAKNKNKGQGTRVRPYEAPVGPDMIPFWKIAKALNDLERAPQEDQSGYEIDVNMAMAIEASYKEPVREPDMEIPNPVGEYTYLKVSRIPKCEEFNDGKFGIPGKEFKRVIINMEKMSAREMLAIKEDRFKEFNFDQRDRFEAERKRIINQRARESFDESKITICPPALEPIKEEAEALNIRIETGYEEWQTEPAETSFGDLDIDIDMLNDHFKIA
jgi:hypothetical protein